MSKLKRTRIRRSAQEWSRILARFEQGGQSYREFCEREGLALSTFQWWRRRLGAVRRERERHKAAWFVELTDESAGSEEVESSTLGWNVELELGGGMVLRLRRASSCWPPVWGSGSGCARGPPDMRRSFDGLSALARNLLGENPASGHWFVFVNRRGTILKILAFDTGGYWIWAKRLEQGRFAAPGARATSSP